MNTIFRPSIVPAGMAVLLAASLPGHGAVTYVNPPDITIPATFDGIYLDLAAGTGTIPGPEGPVLANDAYTVSFGEPAGGIWDVNFFFGGAFVAHSPTFQPYRVDPSAQLSAVHNVAGGATIDGGPIAPPPASGPSAPLVSADYGGSGTTTGGGLDGSPSPTHMGPAANQFTSGTEGYIAFVLDPGPDEQYGWIRVTLNGGGGTGLIHDWAYSDEPLAVGVPEPGALALLGAGAPMLLLRRRRP